ncbi:MAG: hypothetical protein KA715_05840 [Xanthomonadaceae bacterium]|nr:hypothetical protein [Xanthomonadaceae bacterium]
MKGNSEVKGNLCNFEGTITVEQVRVYKKNYHSGEDQPANDKEQGLLIGKYHFKENPKQKHSGVFKGYIVLAWRVASDGKLKIEDNEFGVSDWYTNNQCVGTWSPVKGKKSKHANWGEYRIPDSGDLDSGAGEFHPSAKYIKNGWIDLGR